MVQRTERWESGTVSSKLCGSCIETQQFSILPIKMPLSKRRNSVIIVIGGDDLKAVCNRLMSCIKTPCIVNISTSEIVFCMSLTMDQAVKSGEKTNLADNIQMLQIIQMYVHFKSFFIYVAIMILLDFLG